MRALCSALGWRLAVSPPDHRSAGRSALRSAPRSAHGFAPPRIAGGVPIHQPAASLPVGPPPSFFASTLGAGILSWVLVLVFGRGPPNSARLLQHVKFKQKTKKKTKADREHTDLRINCTFQFSNSSTNGVRAYCAGRVWLQWCV